MIVKLAVGRPPTVEDADRLDRLHVEAAAPLAEVELGSVARPDDDGEHVWLGIAELRAAAAVRAADPSFAAGFDRMVEYARSKGWASPDGTELRAHVERTAS